MPEPATPEQTEGVDWHWGPDPAFGNLTKHVGPREQCSGPDCEPESDAAEGSGAPCCGSHDPAGCIPAVGDAPGVCCSNCPEDTMRARLIAVLEAKPLFGVAEIVDTALRVLAGHPGDLPARMAERLNTTIVTPEGDIETSTSKWDRHDRHRFLYNCAVCQGNVPALVAAAMSVRWEDHAATVAENAELRRRAEHAEGELSALRDHNTRWEAEKARADGLEAERDAQRRETAVAAGMAAQYAQKAIENGQRADQAEAERDLLRETLAESDLGGQVLAQWEAIAAADADRDRLEGELAEVKRVTDPPVKKEMPTDPAELKELWEFINQQARWQWHMAHKFGQQVERVRVLHTREDDPRRTPDCKGCRTVATYTLYEDCKTIAALAVPEGSEDAVTETGDE